MTPSGLVETNVWAPSMLEACHIPQTTVKFYAFIFQKAVTLTGITVLFDVVYSVLP